MIMKFSCIAKQKMLNILDSLYTTYTCHSLYSTTYLYIAHTTEALYTELIISKLLSVVYSTPYLLQIKDLRVSQ